MQPSAYIARLADVNDRVEYHPMVDTLSHVRMVALKATCLIGDRSVIAAAWLHDIAKHPAIGGHEAVGGNGVPYWSNPDNAKQGAELILSDDDLRYAVHTFGAKIDTVVDIVRAHMAVKDHTPKKFAHIPHIQAFRMCDDDINRIPQFAHVYGFDGNRRHIKPTFVGLSPMDMRNGCKTFTVVIGGLPMRYPVADMGRFPIFF